MSVLKNIGYYTENDKENPNKQTHITSYNIPNNITSLGNNCFYKCTKLSSITIPDSVSSLGNDCFRDCSKLSSITIPDSVSSLGNYCFGDCSNLSSITIPDSVSSLGNDCFYKCLNLSSITIPDSVSSLGNNCFENCYNLSSITIPDSVSSLGNNCFYCCFNLSSITIPDSVSSLGNNCFYSCYNLKTIYTNNQKIKPGSYKIPSDCEILPYEQSPDLKPKQIEIKPIKIEPLQITEEYKPNLLDYNEYIKERTELLESYQDKSIVGYHESIIDIAEEFKENVKIKQLELQEYSKIIQNYSNNLSEISTNLTKKINQHTQKLKEIEENNYKLPELNTIKDKLNKILPTVEDEDFNLTIILNDNYYLKDDLIIPKTKSPYTEIYKLPCKFTEITPENKRILAKAEKKIALLPIEYPHEYIDLSNTDIQYFIDTFKNCTNLKEIRYPDSTEYK